ncbi:NTP transferase domain-containing protein [Campylobacter lari]|uniref:nucleotidyltransferase family protein n=1 Tax=Campylobacter lari TaxID=201 RepID=UPI0021F6D9B4|nr:nucleotidyltransferase family protein [Campylobacter lari]EHH0538165.1 NTP transferase domain-containing protein [Campylobacter lari]MCW0188851.1 nucleotidyltransferase family protein [Campylobacter lari]
MRFLPKNITLKQALEFLSDSSGLRLLIIGDKDKWGIVTDPDVRKALLNGFTLNDSIEKIVNYNPIVAYENDSKEKILNLSTQYNIYQIPILNHKNQIIGIENILENTILYKNNIVVIMAGGLGTRLRPLTENIPKPMLKVGNKPILEIIIERFKKQGFKNFILCVNYKADIIENYFKDGKSFDVNIQYTYENKRMGTAGALSLIKDVGKQPFFVTNGDILADINYNTMLNHHIDKKSLATMGVRKHFYQIPYGVVITNDKNQIIDIEEKPEYSFLVNSGVYVLNPEIIDLIPKNEFFDMPKLFENIKEVNKKSVYFIEDYWIDIGRHDEYKQANEDIKNFHGFIND